MAQSNKPISPQIAYGFLGLLGVITLILGFFSLGRIINTPADRAALERQNVFNRVQSDNIAAEQQLRVQDTDLDGLTDFDELNLYGTSPYLADSDSDGFSDKQEIESNNDPNCPIGITCRGLPTAQGNSVVDERGVVVDNFADLLNEPAQEAPTIDLNKLNVDQIRELILQSGEMTPEQLSEIDDDTIMQIYQQMINEAGGSL